LQLRENHGKTSTQKPSGMPAQEAIARLFGVKQKSSINSTESIFSFVVAALYLALRFTIR
jgi:hypothetical protein